uniref:Uncharacterized protein n=1 Tax=Anguilla anguilla TaxID=7936 RepID=A0A0E9PY83_ANGAN
MDTHFGAEGMLNLIITIKGLVIQHIIIIIIIIIIIHLRFFPS